MQMREPFVASRMRSTPHKGASFSGAAPWQHFSYLVSNEAEFEFDFTHTALHWLLSLVPRLGSIFYLLLNEAEFEFDFAHTALNWLLCHLVL